jgi:thiol-disulfide isomerase/thioredoxin
LTTFGIDIWSHLDEEAERRLQAVLCRHSKAADARTGATNTKDVTSHCQNVDEKSSSTDPDFSFSKVLPTILITDRRTDKTGIQRYYLHPPIEADSIKRFFGDFLYGRVQPAIKSSHIEGSLRHASNSDQDDDVLNKYGVHILTGDSLPPFLKKYQEKHVLLQLYAPSCGHCKRFNIIWNSLGDLIRHIDWDDRLVIARFDVSSNEVFVPGVSATWLPDMFYFPVGVIENPVQYAKTETAARVELGGLSDPLDLLDWWMDEAGDSINEKELLQSLSS